MGRKCSVYNCDSGYKTNETFKGHVFGFPADPDDKEAWINSLPNKLTKTTDECDTKPVPK